jgi:voltage-gated potassium channel
MSSAARRLAMLACLRLVVEFMDFARSNIGTEVTMEQVCVTPKGEFTRKTFGHLLELRRE